MHIGLCLATITIATVVSIVSYSPPKTATDSRPSIIAIRVDDTQDYAFKKAQLFLLQHSIENKVPLSLGITAKYFGSDRELVELVSCALRCGSEVAIHGWEHEDLAQFNVQEQADRLHQAKTRLKETLDVDATVLIPPMFGYNNDTLKAMHTAGLNIVSGLSEFHQKGLITEGIVSIPATVELSEYTNGTWKMKNPKTIYGELNRSIETHGYAMILTHPQEFMKADDLNQDAVSTYSTIISNIESTYTFTVIKELQDIV